MKAIFIFPVAEINRFFSGSAVERRWIRRWQGQSLTHHSTADIPRATRCGGGRTQSIPGGAQEETKLRTTTNAPNNVAAYAIMSGRSVRPSYARIIMVAATTMLEQKRRRRVNII